jgi:hypothetical protein
MPDQPTWGKLHSKALADRYVALGWQVVRTFQVEGDDEPYEFLIKWVGPGPAVYPDQPQANPAADAGPPICFISAPFVSKVPIVSKLWRGEL